jgi:hypothetical protein
VSHGKKWGKIATRQVYNWKACLYMDSSRQTFGFVRRRKRRSQLYA